MKKRSLSFLLIMILVLGLCSCKKNETDKNSADTVEFITDIEGELIIEEADEEPEPSPEEIMENRALEILGEMSLEQKVGQMFITRPQNQGSIPIGGICVFSDNITSKEGLISLIDKQNSVSKIPPFIAVDEEGGKVSRIANSGFFDVPKYESMLSIGSTEDAEGAKKAGRDIGGYLSEIGFNLDFAPVADVNTNPNNPVIGARAFSSDPNVASSMVNAFMEGMHEENIITCMKHFPGHGDTSADTHTGFVKIDKTWDEIKDCELIPYYENIKSADMIMVSHISTPIITSDGYPASLSKEMVTDKLRGELGYDGVVITDSLEMGAISQNYTSQQVGVLAVNAGVDILLLPADVSGCYNAVLNGVTNGEISEDKIDESVLRIIKLKLKYGIIPMEEHRQDEEFALGAESLDEYLPLLEGKRVGLLSNQTGMVGDKHTLDILVENGVNVTTIFSPEHGFRGGASAGEKVSDSVDEKTKIPIKSLYGGSKVEASDMEKIDVVICDIQDVGTRFYTYYITMMDMMEKAADFDKTFVVFDRPNPNGYIVDGPVLDMSYKSGVGRIPVPVCHGLTMGEIALMANGEGYLSGGKKVADLIVIKCKGYNHSMRYDIPVATSPNLPNAHAVYLYPSLCGFEGTAVSVGRGTEAPFEIYGHPNMTGCDFSFTPQSCAAAKNPPCQGETCYGVDLRNKSYEEIFEKGFTLEYIIDAYQRMGCPSNFFGNGDFFDKLMGNSWIRQMILEEKSDQEIRIQWQDELETYKTLRERYIIYP